MRVLFLVPWPSEAASTRLRIEQYLPFLRAHGVEPVVRPFMSPRLYRVVYEPGHLRSKVLRVLGGSIRRLLDLTLAARADVVFIHREAFPFGTTIVEQLIQRMGVPIVFDFDDAIYLPASSAPNEFVRNLKRPDKVERLIRMSQVVIAGNDHLERYAAQFNPRTIVLPTPVDTNVYRPKPLRDSSEVVIGWIGSGTTARYVNGLARPLARVLEENSNARVELMGGRAPDLERLPRVTHKKWSLRSELQTLHGFDIGLMPYPNTEWARGKCAFKALLYMSVGVPAVCSDVGMASEMLQPGVDGYLVRSEDEWYEALDNLVRDSGLRTRVGAAGRDVVVSRYSLAEYAPRFLEVLHAAAVRKSAPIEAASVRSRAAASAHPDISSS